MKHIARTVIRKLFPLAMRTEWQRFCNKKKYEQKKEDCAETKRIIDFLSNELKQNDNVEKRQVLAFLKTHGKSVFPYTFTNKYNRKDIKVYADGECGMNYVMYGKKRLYFPRAMEVKRIQELYNSLLIEQNKNSPHCYLTDTFQVLEGDIVADAGVAEGLFALMIIDKVKEIHLFECEPQWIEALEKTFEPWKEKVKIINKYVSNISNETNIALDTYFGENEVNFIKADIEGAELSMLQGARNLLQRKNLRIAVCTYHNQHDAEELHEMLHTHGFTTEFSKGYILFPFDNLTPPYLRKVLLRATK